jgi:hypothetical protein
MSALIRQSHATNDDPLWLSANGDTITGDLTVDGEITTGRLVTTRQLGIGSHAFYDANGATQAGLLITGPGTAVPPANDLMIGVANGQKIRFNQVGNDGFNTSLVPTAPGANLDSFVCGGQISATGIAGSRGMALLQGKYLSSYDATAPNNIEGMRIYSGTSGTPGVTFSQIATQPNAYLYFGQIGQNANTSFLPTAGGANNDTLNVGGQIITQKLTMGAQSCGTDTIPIGATNVVVNSTAVTATSKIFLSFYGAPSAGPGKGVSQGNLITNQTLIVPGTSFRVDLTDADGVSLAASNVAVTFNWMIVN